MSNNMTQDNGIANGPMETLTVLTTGVGFLGAIVGSAALVWNQIVAWLLAQRLLVSADADPLWELPAAGGAGLDLMRLAIVAGVALIVITAVFTSAARVVTRRRRAGDLA